MSSNRRLRINKNKSMRNKIPQNGENDFNISIEDSEPNKQEFDILKSLMLDLKSEIGLLNDKFTKFENCKFENIYFLFNKKLYFFPAFKSIFHKVQSESVSLDKKDFTRTKRHNTNSQSHM